MLNVDLSLSLTRKNYRCSLNVYTGRYGVYMNVSESEFVVLEVLWSESPLTVGQVVERAQQETDWHDNTIKTLLTRLTQKGAVKRFKDGKRFFYAPAVTKDKILFEESQGFLSKYFGGRMAPLVAHFAQNKKLSKKDIEDIESILKKMKKKND